MINIDQRVGDLRRTPGSVCQTRQERVADIAGIAVLVGLGDEEAQPRPQVALLPGCFDDGQFGLLRRPVLQCLPVDPLNTRLSATLCALVESTPGLIAKQTSIQYAQ